ncbi:MAG: hypothetical protein LC098_13555 [Burkholderiales bacterium]|nr:hypothetical protein [Pseudomonadota bacterium]MCZ2136432.1 hypothetical protein [Burkholderiales bacterium]
MKRTAATKSRTNPVPTTVHVTSPKPRNRLAIDPLLRKSGAHQGDAVSARTRRQTLRVREALMSPLTSKRGAEDDATD